MEKRKVVRYLQGLESARLFLAWACNDSKGGCYPYHKEGEWISPEEQKLITLWYETRTVFSREYMQEDLHVFDSGVYADCVSLLRMLRDNKGKALIDNALKVKFGGDWSRVVFPEGEEVMNKYRSYVKDYWRLMESFTEVNR